MGRQNQRHIFLAPMFHPGFLGHFLRALADGWGRIGYQYTWPMIVPVNFICRSASWIREVSGMSKRLQNISTVIMKIHARAGSFKLSFNATGVMAVLTFVSSETARLGFEGKILLGGFMNLW